MLEVKLHSKVPIALEYNLDYVVKYSSLEKNWSEYGIKGNDHVSKSWDIEYNYMADKQEVSFFTSLTNSGIDADHCGDQCYFKRRDKGDY